MIMQITSEVLKTSIYTRGNDARIVSKREKLSTLLDALTMGLFQKLQRAARQSNVTATPNVQNVRITIPVAFACSTSSIRII